MILLAAVLLPCLVSGISNSEKGIAIDDVTITLKPSYSVFPKTWPLSQDKITAIRTFHYADSAEIAWVDWAVRRGIKVVVGITVTEGEPSVASSELDALSSTYTSADAGVQALYDKNVLGIAVGNEIPLSGLSDMTTALDYAISQRKAGALPQVNVTTVLALSTDWILNGYPLVDASFSSSYLKLMDLIDVVSFNCYGGCFSTPLPSGIDLQNSLSWQANATGGESVLVNQFASIRIAMNKAGGDAKAFWVTETGWSSETTTTKDGQEPSDWSTLSSEQTFYTNFLGFTADTLYTVNGGVSSSPDRVFYFTVRDVPTYNNEHFGLFTNVTTSLQLKLQQEN